ncbi:MAG: zf-HC2 domain-containing protein [Gemmatimonadales bacterium]
MHPEWTDLLSAYLDGELDPVTRRRLERHFAECPACASARDDLARIIAAAPQYQGEAPNDRVWAAIQGDIDAHRVVAIGRPSVPARHFGLRHLIAAGLVMALAGGGTAWYLTRPGESTPVAAALPGQPTEAPDATFAGAPVMSAGFDAAVAELEAALATQRSRLDTTTVRVLEESLAAIDRAVAEARAAIQRDTANRYLSGQIAVNLRKKVALLRFATRALAAET